MPRWGPSTAGSPPCRPHRRAGLWMAQPAHRPPWRTREYLAARRAFFASRTSHGREAAWPAVGADGGFEPRIAGRNAGFTRRARRERWPSVSLGTPLPRGGINSSRLQRAGGAPGLPSPVQRNGRKVAPGPIGLTWRPRGSGPGLRQAQGPSRRARSRCSRGTGQ